MVNNCSTTFIFWGKTEDVQELYGFIKDVKTKRTTLKSVLLNASIKTEELEDLKNNGNLVHYAGEVEYACIGVSPEPQKVSEMVVDVKSKWKPMLQMWDLIIKRNNFDIVFAAYAEEPCFNIFEMYNPNEMKVFENLNEAYYVDISENVLESVGYDGKYVLSRDKYDCPIYLPLREVEEIISCLKGSEFFSGITEELKALSDVEEIADVMCDNMPDNEYVSIHKVFRNDDLNTYA